MIPESIDSAKGLYAIGSVILVIGLIAGVVGTLVKRRAEEGHRDERYVRERRGEELVEGEPPRIAVLLQYAGVAIVGLGIVVLVAGWTVDPNGQS
jgi:hypothetical protein